MLYQITNLTHSSKAFRSVNSGEMVFVPPKSEGTYDLAPLGSLDFAGLEIKEATAAPAAVVEEADPPVELPEVVAQPEVVAPPAPPAKPSRGQATAAAAVAATPAPWQQGLAASIKA
jgi:hypothetical protein